jgi:hypothetical protein
MSFPTVCKSPIANIVLDAFLHWTFNSALESTLASIFP